MRVATLCLIFFLIPFAASAQAPASCGNATTQAQLNECAARGYRDADAQLNSTYGAIMARLEKGSDAATKLTSAQRAWILFRDAECQFVSTHVDGGSAQPMVIDMCLEAQTRARTQALLQYLKCGEGDLSCPVPSSR